MTILLGVLILLAVVAGVIGLLALSMALMRKDRSQGSSSALGPAMLEVKDDAGGPPDA